MNKFIIKKKAYTENIERDITTYKVLIEVNIERLHSKLTKIFNRLEYRSNGEYNNKQFRDICEQINNKLNTLEKQIQEIYNIIG